MEKDLSAESRILEAAREVFVRKGYEGARMQEIADEAGINKSLLHYYFRSKEKLFSAVFVGAFMEIVPQINEVLISEQSLVDKIRLFVEKYSAFLLSNPHLPMFILNELQRSPETLTNLIRQNDERIHEFVWQVLPGKQQGKIKSLPPEHLFVNILAMSVFPVIARPILQNILFDDDASRYEAFIAERPETVSHFFRCALESANNKEASS